MLTAVMTLRMTRGSWTIGVCVVALVAATPACKKSNPTSTENPDDSALLAQDGADTSALEVDHELLTGSLVAASSGGSIGLASATDLAGADLVPADLGDGAKAFFFPRGCLTTSNDLATSTVTYAFKNCTGPLGLLRVNGEIKATYQTAPNQLSLDLVGTGLEINRATADWHATAVITSDGGVGRTMTWNAQLSGTTARGRDFSRTNQKTISWKVGERCFTASGVSEGNVKGRNLRTEVTNYARCQGSCPEAGGSITITNVTSGKHVEIDFDGTSTASVTSTSGQTLSLPLLCSG
jgi:hypothetical protein